MSSGSKFGLLILVGVGLVIVRELDLANKEPTELTSLAIAQFQASDGQAEALRVAHVSRNWWLIAAPALLLLAAGALFFEDFCKWAKTEEKAEGNKS